MRHTIGLKKANQQQNRPEYALIIAIAGTAVSARSGSVPLTDCVAEHKAAFKKNIRILQQKRVIACAPVVQDLHAPNRKKITEMRQND
jgi:hypothetical protein